MKRNFTITARSRAAVAAIALFSVIANCISAEAQPLVDDFNNPETTAQGYTRLVITDSEVGGATKIEQSVHEGVIRLAGEIAPPRGQPGWASIVLPLADHGASIDASAYEGIRVSLRIEKGSFSLSANSAEITNFDYHAAILTRPAGNAFAEVKVPFSSMKRVWSEQTKLNSANLASISLVAFGVQKGSFAIEIDEISFY